MVSASPSPNDTTSSPRPRFRQDLVAEPIDELGARFIDVIDPDSGDGFRFYEVEYALACAMDGERDIEGIVRWATEELGLTPSSSEVRTVIATLGELGYLEGGAGAADHATSAPTDVGETAVTAPVAMAAAVAAAQVPAPSAAHRAAVAAAPRPASPSTPPFARSGSTVPPPTAASAAPAASVATPGPNDDLLARGVVVGKAPAATHEPAGDFELGHVGRAAASDERLPHAPDLALGAPGRVESPRSAPRPPVEDIALGGAGAGDGVPNAQTDMSLDLSDHIAVRPDDVKEAVRQSRVMSAVELPKDLIEAETTKAPAPTPTPTPAPPPVAAKPAKAEAAPPARPTPQPPQRNTPLPPSIPSTKPGVGPEVPGPAPVAVATKPVAAAKPAVDLPPVAKQVPANEPAPIAKTAPPAPATRTSPILIALLIVIVIAAAGYVVWRYVLNADDDSTPTTTSEKSTMREAQTCHPSVPT